MLAFGFSKQWDEYQYSVPIVDGQFKLDITLSDEGILHTDVIELASNETYVLHQVHGACGTFVGRIRDEYTFETMELAISRNPVQFQKGMSEGDIDRLYGTESQCREALFV